MTKIELQFHTGTPKESGKYLCVVDIGGVIQVLKLLNYALDLRYVLDEDEFEIIGGSLGGFYDYNSEIECVIYDKIISWAKLPEVEECEVYNE